MRDWIGKKGFTLTEMVISLAIMGILTVGLAGLLHSSLQIQVENDTEADLIREGMLAMDQMTTMVKKSTFVHIPNAQATVRDLLAVSGSINEDGDHYFGDTLFPRIDEDAGNRLTDDGEDGILGLDDDGDGMVDEGAQDDDDEDNANKEDPVNGVDDDSDGNIDEDVPDDMNNDGWPGIQKMDDDGDGESDEGDHQDDDEDGVKDEDSCNPVVFFLDAGTNTLKKYLSPGGTPVHVCGNVQAFSVTYSPSGWYDDARIRIVLTLAGADGATVTFGEYVYPENIRQRCGRRVM